MPTKTKSKTVSPKTIKKPSAPDAGGSRASELKNIAERLDDLTYRFDVMLAILASMGECLFGAGRHDVLHASVADVDSVAALLAQMRAARDR